MRPRRVGLILLVLLVSSYSSSLVGRQSPPASAFDPVTLQPGRGYFSQLPFESVDMVNGHVTLRFTDLVLPGHAGLDLRFTRTYNRDRQGGYWFFGFADVPVRVGMPVAPPPPPPGETQDKWTPVLIMGDGSWKSLYLIQGQWLTTDFWRYDAAARTLYMPNGWVATYEQAGNPSGGIMLEEVHDQFGNSITPHWTRSGQRPWLLENVVQTVADNGNGGRTRTVSFEYTGNNPRLPSSMVFESRRWNYSYDFLVPGTAFYNLTGVQLPENPGWTFAYTQAGWNGSVSVTLPTGGTVSYTFVENDLGGAAPKLSQITTGGYGIQGGTWTFSFSGSVSTVTTPSNRQIRYEHGWHQTSPGNWTLDRKTLTKDGQEIASVATTYTGIPFEVFVGWTQQVPLRRVITQDGQVFATDFQYSGANFGDYLRPNLITESSSTQTNTRVTARSFDYGFTPYIPGKIGSESVSVAGETFSTTYSYDHATGFMQSATRAGVTTTFQRDAMGNGVSSTDADGHWTAAAFQWGAPQTVNTPTSSIVRELNSDGTIALENRGGAITMFSYDNLGRVRTVVPAEGAGSLTEYGSDGHTITVSRAGAWTQTTVDGFGRPTSTTNADGVQTVTTYDVEGFKTFQSHPFTGQSSGGDNFTYDPLGRVKTITHSDNSTVEYAYNGTSVSIKDENDHTTIQEWTVFGDPSDARLVKVTDAAGGQWSYSYNALGSLTRVHGPEGPDRIWQYNGANQLDSDTQPESGSTRYAYYADGLLHRKTDAANAETLYEYDGDHRLTKIDAPGNADDLTFAYDGRGNRTQALSAGVASTFEFDGANRLRMREDRVQGQIFITRFDYDARDNLSQITYPSGRLVTYEYDAADRIIKARANGTVIADAFEYHPSGATKAFTRGNNIRETMTLDSRLRPDHLASGPVDLTYRYDSVGNVKQIIDPRPNASSDFAYDAIDRLTDVFGVGGTSYTYDAQGNRKTKGSGAGQVTYNYDAATNRLLSSASTNSVETGTFTYSPTGNLLTDTNVPSGSIFTYTYTSRNQMATAQLGTGPITRYTYDADGLRTVKSSAAGEQYYVYGIGGQLLAEYAALLTKTAPSSGSIGANTTVTLRWAGLQNATYEVCWDATNNSSCDAAWSSTGAATLKTISNLTPGTYYWQVRATTSSGQALADTNLWWSFTVVEGGFVKLGPAPATTAGSNVTLQWVGLPDSGYSVCWDTTNNDSCDGSWWPNGAATSKPLEGLSPGTYYWQVRAQTPNGQLDGDGGTWWSFTVSGSGGFVKLGPLNGAANLTGDVNLQWSSIPDSGYMVCWDQIDNGQCDTMWWPNGAATIRQVSDLTPGTYFWQAKVWNGVNTWEADGGVWWTFTVGTPVIIFGKQTPGAGAVFTTNAATFSWAAAPNANFYELCVDTINNGVCDTAWITAAQATSRTLTGLTDGIYYWQVRTSLSTGGTTQADFGVWWAITVDAPDPVREYIYLGNRLLATQTLNTGVPVLSYYHTDILGSVRAITNAIGAAIATNDFAPFGETTGQTTSPLGGDPRKFTGKERDPETALDYFNARYNKNSWGRFTTPDPVISERSAADPQLWNRYAYCRDNPLRFADPTGLVVIADEGSWELIRSTVSSDLWKFLSWTKGEDGTAKILLSADVPDTKNIADPIFQALATLIRSSVTYRVSTVNEPTLRSPLGTSDIKMKFLYDEKTGKYATGLSVEPTGVLNGVEYKTKSGDFEVFLWNKSKKTPEGWMRKTTAHELYAHTWLYDQGNRNWAEENGPPSLSADFKARLADVYRWIGWTGR